MCKRRSFLFYPAALVYGLVTSFRNYLYNSGALASGKFSIPVICTGNITVGGTGKTPHVEYLIELLGKEYRLAVLSRGYKRKSSGFRIVPPGSNACESGDEPLQISRKFPEIIVAVDRDRVNGINNLVRKYPGLDLIIMDDGFQHRRIKPGFSILLSDYNRPMHEDHMLPYGNLRESIKNIRRSDIVVITKTPPDISREEMQKITGRLNEVYKKRIFFTSLSYDLPVKVFESTPEKGNDTDDINPGKTGAVLVTGIASPESFIRFAESMFPEIIHLDFPDHHFFVEKDIRKIDRARNSLKSSRRMVITTEKDSVRFRELAGIPDHIRESLYYIPVRVCFPAGGKNEFDKIIYDYAGKNKRDHGISQVSRDLRTRGGHSTGNRAGRAGRKD